MTPQLPEAADAGDKPDGPAHAGGDRPWAELLARTFVVDVLACPRCQGRMKLLALVKNPAIISRTLATVGEATDVPRRSPGSRSAEWKSPCCAVRCSVTRTAAEGGADEVTLGA